MDGCVMGLPFKCGLAVANVNACPEDLYEDRLLRAGGERRSIRCESGRETSEKEGCV